MSTDKLLKPKALDLNVDDPAATRKFEHWLHSCRKFMLTVKLPQEYQDRVTDNVTRAILEEEFKLDVLINLVSADIYSDIRGCTGYTEAIAVLTGLFVKTPSEVYARHRLSTTKQQADQSLEAFRRKLEQLARECNYVEVTAAKNREDNMLIAFLTGINDNSIRMRLLEEKELTFETAYALALQLHEGHKEASGFYHGSTSNPSCAVTALPETGEHHQPPVAAIQGYGANYGHSNYTSQGGDSRKCTRCRYNRCRGGNSCRAERAKCYDCGRTGHYAGSESCQRSTRNRSNPSH